MKKYLFHILSLFLLGTSTLMAQTNFHDFTVKTIEGDSLKLSSFKGKKVLVVNTASECGLTPQYQTLEEIYKEYGQMNNFVVIGFPANNFGQQEPGSDKEIATFCEQNYGVSFPMMSKISVKGGDMHPLYKWLTTKALNQVEDTEVTWNFQKYMIDEDGNYVGMVEPQETPASMKILEWIKS